MYTKNYSCMQTYWITSWCALKKNAMDTVIHWFEKRNWTDLPWHYCCLKSCHEIETMPRYQGDWLKWYHRHCIIPENIHSVITICQKEGECGEFLQGNEFDLTSTVMPCSLNKTAQTLRIKLKMRHDIRWCDDRDDRKPAKRGKFQMYAKLGANYLTIHTNQYMQHNNSDWRGIMISLDSFYQHW